LIRINREPAPHGVRTTFKKLLPQRRKGRKVPQRNSKAMTRLVQSGGFHAAEALRASFLKVFFAFLCAFAPLRWLGRS
jgi:hypothetical protein